MSFTKRHHAHLQYRRSNPNSACQGLLLQALSVHRLNLRNLSLHRNRHINNFVSVLFLRDLDVFGLVPLGVFCLLSSSSPGVISIRFSGGSVSVLLMTPGLHDFDFVDNVFVHGVRQPLSVDLRFREPAPLPCKITSV